MALLTFFPFFFLSLYLLKPAAAITCSTSCPAGGPEVKFPFGLNPDGNPNGPCSYPGFGLSCSNRTHELVLNLPQSGQFVVRYIDYDTQQIWINDPDFCLPRRFLRSFNISGTPFDSEFWYTFTLFNCSAIEAAEGGLRTIPCLSNQNYSIVASQTTSFFDSTNVLQSACRPIRTFTIPFVWYGWWDGVRLEWNNPDCRSCVQRRGDCRFRNRTSLEIECFNMPSQGGLSRSAKYGIIIGVGIPGLLSLIGLVSFIGSRMRTNGRRGNLPSIEFSASISPSQAILITGLDGPTIDSYPKTKLGESGRLPKPNDNICPICLSEYQPKETLRTIPDCNHYFHSHCVDEWLKMNASCPLCRNSPGGSSEVTPSISISSS
ncbi:PHD finger protein-related isoform 1 [Hibiscus syriacus]|uniref:RING-type E3 ubiquitin transferase n=1 Tax=Hibiscus syriacus TaxID=106335 RepID=A0A6A3B6A1_HIBSY|nr:RING-H2 finger protein ATL20-like [Hibiscus syriacus]KAE8710812.1 PHD finger protein-related isoform 1 [Hibiscus syriacus]